ncbi:MAG: cystathionine gamma-synthase [Bernardetiaceae bacterium]
MAHTTDRKFATLAVHAGVTPDPTTGAIMTPIYQTSTYVQASPGKHKGYEYARTQNPTRHALEASLAALEGGKYGLTFGSGMAAIDAILKLLKPGDEVIATDDLYGGTYRIFTKVFADFGIIFKFVGMQDLAQVEAAVTEDTRLIWAETPTNPLMKVIDIAALSKIAKAAGAYLAVDNTFATPYLQQPLSLGADLVMHSVTKYLGGHSDTVMGAIITSDDATAQQLFFLQNACGAVPGPQDCFLVLRGIKTLHLRMQAHCQNARRITDYLRNHPRIDRLYHPSLPDHEGHAIAAKQMRDFGGMLSFTLKGDRLEDTVAVLERFRLFALAESLGGVESLAGHPASMTHASIPREARQKVGLTDSLIRLSVGIEDVDDLIADLEQALG